MQWKSIILLYLFGGLFLENATGAPEPKIICQAGCNAVWLTCVASSLGLPAAISVCNETKDDCMDACSEEDLSSLFDRQPLMQTKDTVHPKETK